MPGPNTPNFSIGEDAVKGIRHIMNTINPGVTVSQNLQALAIYCAVLQLSQENDEIISIRRLTKAVGFHESSVSKAVTLLAKWGLISKENVPAPKQGRRVSITLQKISPYRA